MSEIIDVNLNNHGVCSAAFQIMGLFYQGGYEQIYV